MWVDQQNVVGLDVTAAQVQWVPSDLMLITIPGSVASSKYQVICIIYSTECRKPKRHANV